MQHDNDELDPLDDDYDEKRIQGYRQHPKSENKPIDFDSRRDTPTRRETGKYESVCPACYDLPPDQICSECNVNRGEESRIKKLPDAYGVKANGKLTHVTLRKESADYWASRGTGREVVLLYDHPSKDAMREFARWLREGD